MHGRSGFPDFLKTAKITPVFQPDNAKLVNNYRPTYFYILTPYSKIFEKIVSRLVEYLT